MVFSACNKDETDTDPSPQESVLDYFPLNTGNYWVYERSFCDSTWTQCEAKSTDTTFVTKDTLINNIIYYKVEGVNSLGQSVKSFYRDSLNYVVNSNGTILFSSSDFESKMHEQYVIIDEDDTIFYWYYKMQEELFAIHVPAGSFDCLDNKMSFFRKIDDFEKEFNTHQLYAKNIGPIFNQAMFASSGSGYKSELVDYKIIPKSSSIIP